MKKQGYVARSPNSEQFYVIDAATRESVSTHKSVELAQHYGANVLLMEMRQPGLQIPVYVRGSGARSRADAPTQARRPS